MGRIVNNNSLACILACMLRIYNPMVKFFKYEFNNQLLGDVILLSVTPGV